MCQFGIIYYHFFQRRQTYIRQFFTPSALQYLSTYSTTASNCDLDCSEFSSLCLYTKFFFPEKSSSYISNGVSSSPIYALGAAGISRLKQFKYLIISDLQISPARFFFISAAKGDFKTSLLSSCVCNFKTQFELLNYSPNLVINLSCRFLCCQYQVNSQTSSYSGCTNQPFINSGCSAFNSANSSTIMTRCGNATFCLSLFICLYIFIYMINIEAVQTDSVFSAVQPLLT